MNTATIGFLREDGDFAILATLNNNDEHMSPEQFQAIARTLCEQLAAATGNAIQALHRQDAPDYIDATN